MFRTIPAFLVVLACGAIAGCAEDETPTTPVDPPVQITETFSGSITINGAATHVFTTDDAGDAIAQITALAPDSTVIVSFQFGTWNGTSCQVVLATDDATTGSTLIGRASVGSFCVRVSDVGRLTAPTDYEIRVTHF